MKATFFHSVLIKFIVLVCLFVSVTAQTPQQAADCAREMIARHISEVAPAHGGCALNVMIQIRRLQRTEPGSRTADLIRNEVTSSFTNCYGAIPNPNATVQRLITTINEINDVNDTTFGASSCLDEMWTHIDNVLANSNPLTGSSNTDPHISTIEGVHYSFQAEGIFSGLTTTGRDLEFQVLQRKFPNRPASQNEAVAVRYGETIINIGVTAPILYVNDKPVTENFPITLADGVKISKPNSKSFNIETPKGDKFLIYVRSNFIDYYLRLPPTRVGDIRGGLLGNYDFNKKNDITAQDGKVIKQDNLKKNQELYTVFGKSWRIAPKNSLFVKGILAQYKSFDENFPLEMFDAEAVNQTKKANSLKICQAKGITEEPFLSNCVYDFILTGNTEFVEAQRFSQEVKRNPDQYLSSNANDFVGGYTFEFEHLVGTNQQRFVFDVATSPTKSAVQFKSSAGVIYTLITDYAAQNLISISDNGKVKNGRSRLVSGELDRTVGAEIVKTSQTKNILGYQCTKYLYKDSLIQGEYWAADSVKYQQPIPLSWLIGYIRGEKINRVFFPNFAEFNQNGMVLEAKVLLKSSNPSPINFRVKSIQTGANQNLFDLNGVKIIDTNIVKRSE